MTRSEDRAEYLRAIGHHGYRGEMSTEQRARFVELNEAYCRAESPDGYLCTLPYPHPGQDHETVARPHITSTIEAGDHPEWGDIGKLHPLTVDRWTDAETALEPKRTKRNR